MQIWFSGFVSALVDMVCNPGRIRDCPTQEVILKWQWRGKKGVDSFAYCSSLLEVTLQGLYFWASEFSQSLSAREAVCDSTWSPPVALSWWSSDLPDSVFQFAVDVLLSWFSLFLPDYVPCPGAAHRSYACLSLLGKSSVKLHLAFSSKRLMAFCGWAKTWWSASMF